MPQRLKKWFDSLFPYPDLRTDVDRYHKEKKIPNDVLGKMANVKIGIAILILGIWLLYLLLEMCADLLIQYISK